MSKGTAVPHHTTRTEWVIVGVCFIGMAKHGSNLLRMTAEQYQRRRNARLAAVVKTEREAEANRVDEAMKLHSASAPDAS